MRACTHWWLDYDKDEQQWDSTLIILMPDGTRIAFSCGWETKEEATNWCTLLDEQLDGVTVDIHDTPLQQSEETIIASSSKRVEALELLIRAAYPTTATLFA